MTLDEMKAQTKSTPPDDDPTDPCACAAKEEGTFVPSATPLPLSSYPSGKFSGQGWHLGSRGGE